MTQKAIEILAGGPSPAPSSFILMVEAASIDKQSHPNQVAGTIWDTIELDRSVGVARSWAAKRSTKDTLVVVTADHDQSMHIIGVSNTPDSDYFDRNKRQKVAVKTTAGDQTSPSTVIPTPMRVRGCRLLTRVRRPPTMAAWRECRAFSRLLLPPATRPATLTLLTSVPRRTRSTPRAVTPRTPEPVCGAWRWASVQAITPDPPCQ
jgi:hypothetical protein